MKFNQERQFFHSIASAASGGWNVRIQDHLEPGSIDFAKFTSMLYVIDTSNDWTAAAAMEPSGFKAAQVLAQQAGFSPTQIKDAVGSAVAEISHKSAVNSDETTQVLNILAAALAHTQLFSVIEQQHKTLSGHWLYLVFRGHDASIVGRPVYFSTGTPGFAEPDYLYELARRVVAQDLGNANSNVAKSLGQSAKPGTGAVLSAKFSLAQGTPSWPRPGHR